MKQGYLPRPVRDPEQRRALVARGVRRGIHGMGEITLPATTARHMYKRAEAAMGRALSCFTW